MGPFDQFFKEYNINDEVERRTLEAICVGMLANECLANEHDIEDIMNPKKLKPERADMVRLYMQHKTDSKWLGQAIFLGHTALLEQIDLKIAENDLNDPQVRREMLFKIYPAVEVLSDMGQYLDKHPETMTGYIYEAQCSAIKLRAPVFIGEEIAHNTQEDAKKVLHLYVLLHRADFFKMNLSLPWDMEEYKEYMDDGLAAQMAANWILQKKYIQGPFSRNLPSVQSMRAVFQAIKDKVARDDTVNQVVYGEKAQKECADYIRSGELAKATKVDIVFNQMFCEVRKWRLDENKHPWEDHCASKDYIPSDVHIEWPLKFQTMNLSTMQHPSNWGGLSTFPIQNPYGTNPPTMQPDFIPTLNQGMPFAFPIQSTYGVNPQRMQPNGGFGM